MIEPSSERPDMQNLPRFDESLNCYRLRLRCGRDFLIDAQDLWLLPLANWKSGKHGHIYASASLHRLVMRAVKGQEVDHLHGNRLDLRKSELRFCTASQNCRSRKKHSSNSRGQYCGSRFKGVTFDGRGSGIRKGKWMVVVGKAGTTTRIGRFHREEDAARRYDEFAKDTFGEFAMTNAALGLFGDAPAVGAPAQDAERYIFKCGTEILIDPDDRWLAECAGWKPRKIKLYPETTILLHRLIMRAKPDEFIDHVQGNPFDNRRHMLRRCTQNQNGKNRLKQRRASHSHFKGVSYDIQLARKGRPSCWSAQIRVDDHLIKLGRFRTQEEAARRYDSAAREHFGAFACTNEDLGLYDAVLGKSEAVA